MDAQDFRTLAQQCRELSWIAARSESEVRELLREWIEDFEAEAEVMEGRHSPRRAETVEG
jgi:hypothetical protein